MARYLTLLLCFATALIPTDGFNLETVPSRVFEEKAEWFGHQVLQVQSTQKWVVVSAPLENNRTGKLFRCQYGRKACTELQIEGTTANNSQAMGLSLSGIGAGELMACGPHYEYACGHNMYLSGVCYRMNADYESRAYQNITPGYQECTVKPIDIVFLIDGSGSVNPADFQSMKTFMTVMINLFQGKNANVIFFFFRLFPLGFAAVDYLLPYLSVLIILLCHPRHLHVLSHHIHKPPLSPSSSPLPWQLYP